MSVIQVPAEVPDRIQIEYSQASGEPIVRSLSVDLVMTALRQYAEDGRFDYEHFAKVMQAPPGTTNEQLDVLLGGIDPVISLYSKKKLGERLAAELSSRTTSTSLPQKPGISPERSADSIAKDFNAFEKQLNATGRE